MSTNIIRLTLRIPEELHKALESESRKEFRSMNEQIIYIIDAYLRNDSVRLKDLLNEAIELMKAGAE